MHRNMHTFFPSIIFTFRNILIYPLVVFANIFCTYIRSFRWNLKFFAFWSRKWGKTKPKCLFDQNKKEKYSLTKNTITILTSFFVFCRFQDNDKIALYFTSERKAITGIGQMTFGQLKGQVGLYANSLRALGVKKGDRVVGYMPNCPEAIIGNFSNHFPKNFSWNQLFSNF